MRQFLVPFVALLLAARVSSNASADSDLKGLFSRQSSDPLSGIPGGVPSECQSPCSSLVNQLTSCSSFDCLCTDSVGNAFESCISCAVSQPGQPSDTMQTAQKGLDSQTQTCKNAGKPYSHDLKVNSGINVVVGKALLAGVSISAILSLAM